MARKTCLLWLLLLATYPPSHLASQVDPRGSWRTVQSPHFEIHARAGQEDLARRAAAEAEHAWLALSALLRPPRGRIQLVLSDDADISNGFASTYPVPRVVIFALPPAADMQLGFYDDWLRLVITHELAHVFHLDRARGWWSVGRSVLGRAPFLFPNQYAPAWVREGAAVFYESQLTSAGRMDGSFHRAVVDAARAERGGMSVSEASIGSGTWPAGLRAYTHGGTFMREAARRGGDSAVARFIENTANEWIPFIGLSGAMRDAAGAGIGRIWGEWQQNARNAQALRRSDGQTLFDGLRLSIAPRLSPDGSKLAFVHSNGRDVPRLRVIDLATGTHRDVSRVNAPSAIAWGPDGALLVSQLEYTDAYTIRSDLFRITESEERMTRGERILSFDVARDYDIVAVRAVAGGTELIQLRLPGDASVLIGAEPGVDWAEPRLSPDGRSIAAVRVRGGWHDIVIVDRETRELRLVTSDSVRDLSPAFTPDGAALVWSREVDGVAQVVRWTVDGRRLTVVTAEPFAAWSPAVSNDSVWYFAYHSNGFALKKAALTPIHELPITLATHHPSPLTSDTSRSFRSYNPLRYLRPRFWMPLGYIERRGSWLGAVTAGSDPLDRHHYSASLELGTGFYAGNWRGTMAWSFAGPGSARLDAGYTRDRLPFIADTVTDEVVCCLSDEAASAGLTFIRRKWRSNASLRTALLWERDGAVERSGGVVSAAWSRANSAAQAISTQDGARFSASLRYRRRHDRDLASADLGLRLSAYRSVSGANLWARPVTALRLAAGGVVGNDNVAFSVGGEGGSSITLVPGLVTVGTSRSYPVRGYPGGFLAGRHVGSVALEQRVPLALIARNLGLMPVGLDHISATVFGDAGVAIARFYCPAGSTERCARGIGSVGAELSALVAAGYDFPVVARLGMAARLAHASGLGWYAAFGSSF